MEAMSAKSAMKAPSTAFFTRAGTCVSAMSALYSSGKEGEEESAPCVARSSKTSSKPTDPKLQNVERKFIVKTPVIFNKTRTLPFQERNVLSIIYKGQLRPGGHDLS